MITDRRTLFKVVVRHGGLMVPNEEHTLAAFDFGQVVRLLEGQEVISVNEGEEVLLIVEEDEECE